jgi:hypothetical protein
VAYHLSASRVCKQLVKDVLDFICLRLVAWAEIVGKASERESVEPVA